MGYASDEEEQTSIPKLSYKSFPSKLLLPQDVPSPPRKPLASVPFKWEEAPGKARQSVIDMHDMSERSLELPPRLMLPNEAKITNLDSPTTVLDGPYVGSSGRSGCQTFSFRKIGSSFRSPEGKEKVVFGSSRWSFPVEETKEKIASVGRRGNVLLVSIYEGFKHMVPWKRRQEKWRRMSV